MAATHKRFHFHFTPTSSSWLNLVERWFRELTDKALRRGSFNSVPELIAAAKKDPAAKALAERTQGSVRVLRKPFTDESLVSLVQQLARPKSLI